MLPISSYEMLFDPSRYTFLNAYGELLRVKDVCKVLGIGRTTLYDLINRGRLKGIKMSRRDTYFKRLEIMRFLDEAARNELVTPTLKRSISQNTPQD
jgi:excisionase family DNA binding protein